MNESTSLFATHILIVNSNHAIQESATSLLNNAGYQYITVVEDPIRALDVLRIHDVGLLICDSEMDALDGWRLARLVRSNVLSPAANIPIILLAEIWCERIAEVTVREYGINILLPIEQIDQLPKYAFDVLSVPGSKQNKPSLLVIEDLEDTSELVKRVLNSRFDIEVAEDGHAGLQAWLDRRHDLVLLDIMLPELSGEQVLDKILSYRRDQPIVMMTAHASAEQACELMISGAVDFISKPFRPEQLRQVTEIATRREDYLVSNRQFAASVKSLADSEAAYKTISETHRQLLNNLQTVVVELDHQLRITFLNEAWETVTGFTIQESKGRLLKEFLGVDYKEKHKELDEIFRSIQDRKQKNSELELSLVHKKGHQLWVQVKVNRAHTSNTVSSLTICLDDVTRRKEAQGQLEYLAMHDSLTGLYNRHYFEKSLQRFSDDAVRNLRVHGLLYIDLDHFKVVNDTFGHHKGNEVLCEVSRVIQSHVRSSDVLCRLGGDEFAVLVHDINRVKVVDLAMKLQQVISSFNLCLTEQLFNFGCSLGVSLIDSSAQSAEEYLQRADIALYVAKNRGGKMVHMYDPEDAESEELRLSIHWTRQVHEAIAAQRMVLFFQPILDIASKTAHYYEALIRLRDIDGNIVYPGDFIPALEHTGEMPILDREVIRLAIASLKEHPKINRIAINLSAQTFKDEKLVPMIREGLQTTGVDPAKITFELTESASLFNLSITQDVVSTIQGLGCSFAIDDFGSGFSSFSYLKQLPADYIKLDGSFIRNLHKDTVDQALVRSIVEVIKTLGKRIVAEFVENGEILQLLEDYGVDFAQGYYIGRPLPIEQLFEAPGDY